MIQRMGNINKDEMFRTFNMGIGYTLITSPSQSDNVLKSLHTKGEKPIIIGEVKAGIQGVVLS
jgi:phosphoribosylformylglycinamidine cyclo-ligase